MRFHEIIQIFLFLTFTITSLTTRGENEAGQVKLY